MEFDWFECLGQPVILTSLSRELWYVARSITKKTKQKYIWTFKTNNSACCQYLLSCKKPGCEELYWGCTKRSLYIRFAEHLLNTWTLWGTHTQPALLGHIPDHLQVLEVEKLGDHSLPVLREREKNMINVTGLFGTGMNTTCSKGIIV